MRYASGSVVTVENRADSFRVTLLTVEGAFTVDANEDVRVLGADGVVLGSAAVLVPGEVVDVDYFEAPGAKANVLHLQ
jgi:hypothetical protein